MLQKLKGKTLNRSILDYLLENGAVSAGLSTRETLADSPPSADITYLMDTGRSAITFAVPTDKEGILPYPSKEDRFALSSAEIAKAQQLCHDLAVMLEGEGHRAMATESNLRYRTEVENWQSFFPPDISHRYLAVVSGAGSFGWSGNVGVKGYGTAVALATVITDVELEPTAPIPEEERFCSNCKACARACPVEMFSETEKTSVTIGGRQFTHAARIDWARCGISCAGITGLHKSKKWSSWSPGRYEIPEDKNEFYQMIQRGTTAREQWPPMEGETVFSIGENSKHGSEGAYEISFTQTCQNCSLVCAGGDKKETLGNLKALLNSGCVIQYPDGSLKVLPPDEAEAEFDRFPPEHRARYC